MKRRAEEHLIKPDLSLIDPHQAYRIYTANKEFSQPVGDVVFTNGQTFLDAMPQDADPDEVEDRRLFLEWIQNCPQTRREVRTFDEDKNVLVVSGYRYEPTYRVEPVAGAGAPQTPAQRARAMRAAEAEGAPA